MPGDNMVDVPMASQSRAQNLLSSNLMANQTGSLVVYKQHHESSGLRGGIEPPLHDNRSMSLKLNMGKGTLNFKNGVFGKRW